MRKTIIYIILLMCNISIFGQSIDTCLTKEKIVHIATTINELKQTDSIHVLQIFTLNKLVHNYELVNSLNSEKIEIQNKELSIYKEAILDMQSLMKSQNPKWYETKTSNILLGFIIGTVSIYTGSLIINNIR